MIAIFKGLLEN
jgi:Ran GTPase-activating protein (RanGAP) involved in mRNA processing and transport